MTTGTTQHCCDDEEVRRIRKLFTSPYGFYFYTAIGEAINWRETGELNRDNYGMFRCNGMLTETGDVKPEVWFVIDNDILTSRRSQSKDTIPSLAPRTTAKPAFLSLVRGAWNKIRKLSLG